MTSSVSLAAFALALFVAQQGCAEASLMGRGIYRKTHHNKVKPWDMPRKNYFYKYDLHDGAEDNDSWRAEEEEEDDGGVDENGNKPCVGLCYLNKLQAIREGGEGAGHPMEEEVVFDPLTTQRPCVGLCHYYRSLGVDNPYEKRDQAKFTP